jgi:tetratricopeptide (TPR) repeat protein
MVGRARELAMLHAVWAHVVQGHGRVVSIVGEAGMGKSRLVTAWRVSLRRQLHLYVQGSCLSYEQEKPYQPIVALLRHACGITAAHTPTMIAAKVHRLLSKIGLDPVVAAPHLLPLLGGDTASHCLAPRSPEARQACTLATLVQLCQQSSARSPLVIVVEDLHWIDAASEAWLAGLVEQLANRRILLLVTCRPGYHPPWLGCSYATQVRLSRLTLQDSAQLVHALCPLQRLPSALQHEIATCADGNPFYLTELTRSVVTDGGTQLPPVLPDTISTVLSARLDRLTPVTKRVVQTAAVIGTETSLALLEAVTQCSKEALSQSLAQLQTAALLAKTGLASEPVYTFTHGLIRETAYQALLESTRRRQHLHIAQVVTAQFATMAVMQPAWLAQQYTQAGCVEQAISYWQEAGQLAADHAAHAEAIVYFTQALTLVRTLPVTPAWVRQAFTLQCRLGGQLATRGAATPEVERTYAQALELYQQVGNAQELCSVLYGLSRMYKKRGKLRCARDLGAQMLMLAQHQGNTALLLRGHYVLGEALLWLGEFVSARAHLEHGLAAYDPQQHARQDGLAAAEPWLGCLGALAITLWFLGYPDQAMQRSAEAMHVAQALAHPYSLACALVDAAYLHWFCGDWEKLWERTETLRTLAAAHGFAELYARAMYRAGLALVKQGEIDAGLRQFHESLHALQVMGSEDAQALRFAQLAELCGDAGQPEAGLEALATAMSAETDERFDAAGRCRLQGELLLQLPCPDMRQAEVCFQQALTIAREQRAKMQELRAALCLSHLWYAQGKRTEAYQLLTPVYGWFTEGFMVPDLQAASAWLEQLA